MKLFKQVRRYGAQVVVGGSALVGSAVALAEDPATPLAALSSLTGTQAGYGPVLFGLAIATVGIMIGIKWIKRGKSAA